MSARELITEHLDLWTGAVTKKSSSGRGSNGKVELTGVKRLRELILSLAVRGKLVPQNSEGPSAASLLVDIEAKKKELYHAKIVKKPKKLCQPQSDEAPWPLPSSWEWVKLPDIYYPISPSGKKLKSSETLDIGQFPVVDQGQSYISGYTDDASLVIEIPHPVIVFGDHTTARKYIDFSFVPGADGTKILCPILVNPRFFYLQLLGYDLENRGYARHFKVLNENFFALPPLEEQHRIVQKVDELMALCDRLEQQTSDQLEAHETLVDTLLSTLTQSENATELADNWARLAAHFDTLFTTDKSIDKLKQTILQLAVMGRLVEQATGDEPGSALVAKMLETRDQLAANEGMKTKAANEVPTDDIYLNLPVNWGWIRLGNMAKFIDYRGKTPTKTDGGRRLITAKNIRKGYIDLEPEEFISENDYIEWMTRGFPRKGDLLFTPEAPLGNAAIVNINEDFALAQRAICFQWHFVDVSSFMLIQIMASPFQKKLVENATGMTATGIKSSKLKEIPVAIPPLEEQCRIVQKVDELMALCERLKVRLSQANDTQCKLAEAVVYEAVS